jgi:hypothetical protein
MSIEHLDPADWKFRDAPGHTLHRIGRRGDGRLSVDYTDEDGDWITCAYRENGRRFIPDNETGLDLIPAPRPVEWMATYRLGTGDARRTAWYEKREQVSGVILGDTPIELWARMSDGTLRRYYPEGKA